MTKEKLLEAQHWLRIIEDNEMELSGCERFTIKDYNGTDQCPVVRSYNGAMTIPFDLVEPIRNMLIGFYKQEIEAAKEIFEKM